MNNQDHVSESLETIFWVNILKFFGADPGQKKIGSWIRDKHPGSATLVTVKWGKSEHLKFFKVVLKLFSDAVSPFFLQKSWYQKFYFLFQDLTDRF